MLRWVFYGAGGLLVLGGAVAAIGAMLPVQHRVSRQTTFGRPPAEVFDVITGFARYPEWRRGVTRVTIEGAGTGAIVREEGSDGTLPMRIETLEPPRRLVTRIADPSLPFGGTWTYDLRPVDAGTELTITEDGEVYNVIFRFMSRYVFGHAATIERYLEDLAQRLK